MRTIFDIETDGFLREVSNIWCIVCRDVDTGEVKTFGPNDVDQGLVWLRQQDELIGHNIINFDIPVLEKLKGFSFKGKITDTLVLSRLIHTNLGDQDRLANLKAGGLPPSLNGSHSLKAWGYRMGTLKGTFLEDKDITQFHEEVIFYCIKDTEITAQLLKILEAEGWKGECIRLEHEFAVCMSFMERRGFSFDVDKARELYGRLSQRKLQLNDTFQEIFPPDTLEMKSTMWRTPDGILHDTKKIAVTLGYKAKDIMKGPHKLKRIPFNPGSRDHIADRLKRLGWSPKEFTPEGKPKVDESVLLKLKLNGDQQYVESLREYLLLVKRMGQLAEGKQAWMKAEYRGRIHGRINTNGAITGRCTHSTPNMAQVPRVGSPYGKECRSLFKATDGYEMVGCDASGLELRCLAHYLQPFDGGDYVNRILKCDIHVENQEAAGLPTRDSAKTFIYAFLYGAGDEKIGEVIGKGREAGKKIKQTFLSSLPALRQLKTCIADVLGSRDWLKGLDGRKLYIRSAHAALNTLLQSAGAVIMKQATIQLTAAMERRGLERDKDWAIVAHIHDEIQMEALPAHVDILKKEAVDAIREAGNKLKFRCPLDGEAISGSNWSETH